MTVIIYALTTDKTYEEWGTIDDDGFVETSRTLDRGGIDDFHDYIDFLETRVRVQLTDPKSILKHCDGPNVKAIYQPDGSDHTIHSASHPLFD